MEIKLRVEVIFTFKGKIVLPGLSSIPISSVNYVRSYLPAEALYY